MAVRAIRGATQLAADTREQMLERVIELVQQIMADNQLQPDDFISVLFTATPDLVAEFPAFAARQLGFAEVPLICAQEINVPGAMPRVVRVLAHVESELTKAEIKHVYLHGAAGLRKDLNQAGAND